MPVVTWKNIAPSNPAGILSAANEAAQAIGEGFAGVGDAALDFSEDKTQRETDAFVSELMGLETQEERDAMIAEANDAWLNIDTINKTNYELGAPEREKAAYEEKAAFDFLKDKELADYKLKLDKEYWSHQVQNPKPSTGSGSGSSKNKFNPKDNNPFKGGKDAIFKYQEGKFGFGTGIGIEDEQHYNEGIHNFLTECSKQIPSHY